MRLFTPSDGPPWLRRFSDSILATFKARLSAPLWLWSAETTHLPTSSDLGANSGALAFDDSDHRPTYHDGSVWKQLQPYDPTLAALAAFGATGLIAQTAPDSFAGRTIAGPAAGLSVANGDGAGGNPTIALANDLAALEGLSGTGIARRTGTDAWSVGTTVAVNEGGTGGAAASGTLLDNITGFASTGQIVRTGSGAYAFRTLTGPAVGISVSNGSGVSGNPTLALANDLSALEGLSGTGIARRTGTDAWSVGTTVSVAEGGTGATSVKAAIAALRNGAMVKKSADQIGANYTAGPVIAWDAEIYDDDGWHDNITNNSRLSVPSGISRVRVGASVKIANGTTTSTIFLSLLKSGAASYDGACGTSFVAGQTSPMLSFASGPIPVTGGTDYFELSLFYATDTSIDIVAAQSNFWIEAA